MQVLAAATVLPGKAPSRCLIEIQCCAMHRLRNTSIVHFVLLMYLYFVLGINTSKVPFSEVFPTGHAFCS